MCNDGISFPPKLIISWTCSRGNGDDDCVRAGEGGMHTGVARESLTTWALVSWVIFVAILCSGALEEDHSRKLNHASGRLQSIRAASVQKWPFVNSHEHQERKERRTVRQTRAGGGNLAGRERGCDYDDIFHWFFSTHCTWMWDGA